MNSAEFAESVLGRPGVELLGRQVVLTAKQLKLLRRHDEMKKTLFRADRAVAFRHVIQIPRDAKAHATAMASAFHYLLHWCSLQSQFDNSASAPHTPGFYASKRRLQ